MNTTTEPKKKIHWPLWALLVFCGGISLTLSVIHAYGKVQEGDNTGAVVALLTGLAPVVSAALLAHLLTDPYSTVGLKGGVGVVFIGAMSLSLKAQAETVHRYVGDYFDIVFPLVLDFSTIVALLALGGVGYKYQSELAKAALRAEVLPSVKAEVRTELEGEFAARERELREEHERNTAAALAEQKRELTAEHEARRSEELDEREQALREEFVVRARAIAEEARRDAETGIEQRIQDAVIEAESRTRLELSTTTTTTTRRTTKAIAAPAKRADGQASDGLTKKDRALSLIRSNPGITVAELARLADCTTKYARNILNGIDSDADNGSEETPEEEVRLRAVK